jgi:hypothetical protein
MKKKIPIRIDLEGEEAERFETVKDYRGIKANTDLIRVLVSDEYNKILGKEPKRVVAEVPTR